MRFRFERLPGSVIDIARPALEVAVVGPSAMLATMCLVDTGSLHNRFASWVAEEIGIDLADVEPEPIGVGGALTTARTVTTTLQVGEYAWDAPVSFCDPWPFDFHLLGQQGFLRWFRVIIDAADDSFELIVRTQ